MGTQLPLTPEPHRRDELWDAHRVAKWLDLKVSWVYAKTRAGEIPHLKLGGYYRYRLSTLRRWLDSLEEGGGL